MCWFPLGAAINLAIMSALIDALCRQEWVKLPECAGLCTLALDRRKRGRRLDSVLNTISRYLMHFEIVVCVRTTVGCALKHSYLQLVDAVRNKKLAVMALLQTR